MDNFDKLKEFVIDQRWEYSPMTLETSLRNDLVLWGDDAIEFIEAYGKFFEVDISNFNFSKYFPEEGGMLLPLLLTKLRAPEDSGYSQLTLGDLVKGIEMGSLI